RDKEAGTLDRGDAFLAAPLPFEQREPIVTLLEIPAVSTMSLVCVISDEGDDSMPRLAYIRRFPQVLRIALPLHRAGAKPVCPRRQAPQTQAFRFQRAINPLLGLATSHDNWGWESDFQAPCCNLENTRIGAWLFASRVGEENRGDVFAMLPQANQH